MSTPYIYPSYEAGKQLFQKNLVGEIVNVNLIKLKAIADYSAFPEIAPKAEISGHDAFMSYVKLAEPFLKAKGGEILFIGKGDHFLIGPPDEQWDICMLIRQKSVSDFFSFEQDAEYLKITGHRIAAIADARLLPVQELFTR